MRNVSCHTRGSGMSCGHNIQHSFGLSKLLACNQRICISLYNTDDGGSGSGCSSCRNFEWGPVAVGVQLQMGAHTWHNLFITVVPDI